MQNNKANLSLVHGDIPSWAYTAAKSILDEVREKDPATYYHCLRVGEYSRLLAKFSGLTEYQQKVAEFAGMLHDIGKITVGPEITHKPGKLSEEEYEMMKNHPCASEQMITPLSHHEFFRQVIPAVRGHHERVDGFGYPDKLAGEEIPVLSRVILIVDTLDAMAENRAYRRGLPQDVIYREIQRCSGTQFDKALVKIFLETHSLWSSERREQETLEKIVVKSAA